MNEKGGFIVLLLPVTLMLFIVSIFIVDVGRGCLASERSQTWADAAVLSSLRIRGKHLGIVSGRWQRVQGLFTGATESEAFVPADDWDNLLSEIEDLRGSISGYAGRIRTVISLVATANGAERGSAQITEGGALTLRVTAQPQWIEDQNRNRKLVPALWYRREWAPAEPLGEPDEIGAIKVPSTVPLLGAGLVPGAAREWTFAREATGRLRWDVSLQNPEIQNRGNGGYPRAWSDAIEEGQLVPFRFPVYRAELITGDD